MNPQDLALYLVTDEPAHYKHGLLAGVEAAIAGGATLVQYRATTPEKRALYETAVSLRDLTRSCKVPLIINDHVDLALAVDADGVHVGQDDLPAVVARRLIGPMKILGLSISSREEYDAADLALVDYLGVGPVFPTGSKPDAAAPTGLAILHDIVRRSPRPVVAIGGISTENAAQVFSCGAAGIAVISALSHADDQASAARALLAARTDIRIRDSSE